MNFVLLLSLLLALLASPSQGLDEENEVLRWSSAGGSFRNLVSNMGYANVFAKAGLFGQEASSSKFTALSGQSGGSWFAAFFFYSMDFYNLTTQSTPQELADLVIRGMGAYRDYSETAYQDDPLCVLISKVARFIPDDDAFIEACGTISSVFGNWAELNQGVIRAIAKEFGISGIESTRMDQSNRVPPLASTDMYLQMTMMPSSRARKGVDTISYLGLKGEHSVFSVPIDVQYSVTNTYADYISNTPNGTAFPSGMVTYADVRPVVFPFTDPQTYEIYPGKKGNVFAKVPITATLKGPVRAPFGGLTPTISQITAASTSVPGFYASSVPSTFAQVLSTFIPIPGLREAALVALKAILTPPYATPVLDDLAVCSQWPMAKCDARDVRLADGYAADAPTCALNLGQYQTIQNGNLSKTIKLILTPPNIFAGEQPLYLMSYFNTTFNQGVEPGDFLWPSNSLIVPLRSPQIFADYLDVEEYFELLERVPGVPLSTTRIQTTTIDNPTFLVKGGQKVDILMLQLQSNIPLGILGVESIERWTGPLAQLIEDISESKKLLEIVQDFVSSPPPEMVTAEEAAEDPTTARDDQHGQNLRRHS